MQYAPHTLYVQRKTETRDEYNRTSSVSDEWVLVGPCRCDDNSTSIMAYDNSKEYVPRYHIVTERTHMVNSGDNVRVFNADGSLRGEGKADNVKVLNYLNYTDFYAGY